MTTYYYLDLCYLGASYWRGQYPLARYDLDLDSIVVCWLSDRCE